MNIDEFIVQVAIPEHRVFAEEIVTEMAESLNAHLSTFLVKWRRVKP
jgi:hypothetical protein